MYSPHHTNLKLNDIFLNEKRFTFYKTEFFFPLALINEDVPHGEEFRWEKIIGK